MAFQGRWELIIHRPMQSEYALAPPVSCPQASMCLGLLPCLTQFSGMNAVVMLCSVEGLEGGQDASTCPQSAKYAHASARKCASAWRAGRLLLFAF